MTLAQANLQNDISAPLGQRLLASQLTSANSLDQKSQNLDLVNQSLGIQAGPSTKAVLPHLDADNDTNFNKYESPQQKLLSIQSKFMPLDELDNAINSQNNQDQQDAENSKNQPSKNQWDYPLSFSMNVADTASECLDAVDIQARNDLDKICELNLESQQTFKAMSGQFPQGSSAQQVAAALMLGIDLKNEKGQVIQAESLKHQLDEIKEKEELKQMQLAGISPPKKPVKQKHFNVQVSLENDQNVEGYLEGRHSGTPLSSQRDMFKEVLNEFNTQSAKQRWRPEEYEKQFLPPAISKLNYLVNQPPPKIET